VYSFGKNLLGLGNWGWNSKNKKQAKESPRLTDKEVVPSIVKNPVFSDKTD